MQPIVPLWMRNRDMSYDGVDSVFELREEEEREKAMMRIIRGGKKIEERVKKSGLLVLRQG